MRELLARVGFRFTPPLERAANKAQKELTSWRQNPRKLRDYWYRYESLAGVIQTHGIKEEVLLERGARPRRGLHFSDVETVVGRTLNVLSDTTRVSIDPLAANLQVVVKFTRKGRRMFPKTMATEPNI